MERQGGRRECLRGFKVKMSLASSIEPRCIQRFDDRIGDLHVE